MTDSPILAAAEVGRRQRRALEQATGAEQAATALVRRDTSADARPHCEEVLGTDEQLDARSGQRADGGSDAGRRFAARSSVRPATPDGGLGRLDVRRTRGGRTRGARPANPEVAERLFLCRRTVKAQVSSALGELGITSRVELAADAARRRATTS